MFTLHTIQEMQEEQVICARRKSSTAGSTSRIQTGDRTRAHNALQGRSGLTNKKKKVYDNLDLLHQLLNTAFETLKIINLWYRKQLWKCLSQIINCLLSNYNQKKKSSFSRSGSQPQSTAAPLLRRAVCSSIFRMEGFFFSNLTILKIFTSNFKKKKP